jgi:hypothetical protein
VVCIFHPEGAVGADQGAKAATGIAKIEADPRFEKRKISQPPRSTCASGPARAAKGFEPGIMRDGFGFSDC